MLKGLDSWEQPNAAQIAAAKAAGYAFWMGYFKQTATDDIYSGWTDATFESVKAGGLLTGAYCSQLDDPTWVRTRAASLGIIAILDDESGIDSDNAGTDAWLSTAGAHLYGGSAVQATHRTHAHLGYVFSEYPTAGNPNGLNWPAGFAQPSPARPMGWQYSDKGSVGGLSVDLSVFDPAFWEVTMTPAQAQLLQDIHDALFGAAEGGTAPPTNAPWSNFEIFRRQLTDLGAPYCPNALNPFVPDPLTPVASSLTAEQAAQLTSIQTQLTALIASLKGA